VEGGRGGGPGAGFRATVGTADRGPRRVGAAERSDAGAAPVWSAVSIRRGAFHSPCLRWVGGRGAGGWPASIGTGGRLRRNPHGGASTELSRRVARPAAGWIDPSQKTTRQEALQATISPGPVPEVLPTSGFGGVMRPLPPWSCGSTLCL
jgi:hypothetical protein